MDTADICDDALRPPDGASGNENVPLRIKMSEMDVCGLQIDTGELKMTDMAGDSASSDGPSTLGGNESSNDEYGSSNYNSLKLMSGLSIHELNETLPTDYSIGSSTPETPRSATIKHDEDGEVKDALDTLNWTFPTKHEMRMDFIGPQNEQEPEDGDLEISDDEEQEEAVVCDSGNSCSDKWCRECKKCLKCADYSYQPDCRSCMKAVKYIQEHQNRDCCEVRCRVPYCKALTDHPTLKLYEIIQRSGQLWWKLTVQEMEKSGSHFTQLHDSSPGDLKTALDCNFICYLGSFGRFSTLLTKNESQYRVLKKIVTQDTNMLTDVLKDVSFACCPNIIQLFWTVECGKHVYICMPFEMGGSLEEYITDLTAPQIGCCLRQFIDALTYLHQDSKKIVYLLWTCANILINFGDATCKPEFTVKLSNFSAAVHVQKAITDPDVIEDIYLSVIPAVVIPPELANEGPCLMSDMWGLGCIAYELVNKHRVHHDLRHCSPPEYVREMVQNRSVPPVYSSEFGDFMSRCFQVNAKDRADLDELYALTL